MIIAEAEFDYNVFKNGELGRIEDKQGQKEHGGL